MIRPASWRAEGVLSAVVLIALVGVAALLVLVPLWSSTFGPADWRWIELRAPWTLDSILSPEAGWWASLPIALFKTVLSWKALLTYHQYAALGFAGHIAAVLALYALVRAKASPWIATGSAALLLFFGAAGVAVFTAPGLLATLPVALGCLAWFLWDRSTRSTWRDAAGALALIGALASGPAGLAFASAALATFLRHRPARRRLIWPVLALAPIVAWQVAYGVTRDVGALADRASAFIAALATALLGLGPALAPLALLSIVVIAAVTVRRVQPGPLRGTLAATSTGLIVLLITAGLSSPATDPALLYAGAALLLLAGATVVAPWATQPRLEAPGGGNRAAIAGAALLGAITVLVAIQVHDLVTSTGQEVQRAAIAVAELDLVDRVRPVLPSAATAQPIDEPVLGALTPSGYYQVRDGLRGPPTWSRASKNVAKALKDRLDALLFDLTRGGLRVVSDGPPPSAETIDASFVGAGGLAPLGSEGRCPTFSVPIGDPYLQVRLKASEEVYIRSDGVASTQLFLRSLAGDFQEEASIRTTAAPGAWQHVVLPRLPTGLSWSLRLDPPGDANIQELCVVAPPPPIAVRLEPVVTGLDFPVGLVAANDGSGRLFVLQRAGGIRVIADGKLQPQPFLDIAPLVSVQGEEGLLGLAFHPDFRTNGRFFVHYTDLAGNTVIAEYHAAPGAAVADATSGRIVLRYSQPTNIHQGGMIVFGPDGYLYIGQGDGTYIFGTQTAGTGQHLTDLLGKILRIDVDHGSPYAIPPDNPFADGSGGRPEIWAYGLRNPWRFSFDRATGDLWIGDVGHQRIEEIDFQAAGAKGGQNYGWSILEGPACFRAFTCDRTGLVPPLVSYAHENGLRCAVIGGYVYRGTAYPRLYGTYLFADFCGGSLLSVVGRGSDAHIVGLLTTNLVITSFGEDEAGELYLTDIVGGGVYRIAMDP